MKRLAYAAACAAVLFAAPAAQAADSVVARLQQPLAEKTRLIVGGAMFLCEADACTAPAATSATYAPATCKALATKVGAVVGFTDGRKTFAAQRLADCNAGAARPALAQVAAQQ